jgi:hypothetical protein
MVLRRGFRRWSWEGRVFCSVQEAGECGFGISDGNSGRRGVGQAVGEEPMLPRGS